MFYSSEKGWFQWVAVGRVGCNEADAWAIIIKQYRR